MGGGLPGIGWIPLYRYVGVVLHHSMNRLPLVKLMNTVIRSGDRLGVYPFLGQPIQLCYAHLLSLCIIPSLP